MRWLARKEKDRDPETDTVGPARRAGVGPATMVRAGAVCLWVLVVVGAVSGVAGLARPTPRLAAAQSPPPASPVTATGWAQLYVSAWLAAGEGDEAQLRSFFPGAPALTGVRSGGLWAPRTEAVAATETSPGYWSVTVAAEVMVAEPGGWKPAGTRHYLVAVAAAGPALVATALPAQVAAPPLARPPKLAFQALGSRVPPELKDSVERFVAAYAAGDGELERYVTPRSPLRPVRPAPFAKTEVESVAVDGPVATDRPVRVLATVRATDPAGRVAFLSYPLALASRDGRWEITEILAVPPLAPAREGAGRPPSTAPSPSTSLPTSTSTSTLTAAVPGPAPAPQGAPTSTSVPSLPAAPPTP